VAEHGQVLGGEEHLDAAHDAWLAADVTEALQREDHLVHGRRVTRVGLIVAIIAVPARRYALALPSPPARKRDRGAASPGAERGFQSGRLVAGHVNAYFSRSWVSTREER
jgi:hypothetical protein